MNFTQVGSTVSLECHAEGYPDPSISWQREDKKYLRVKEDSGEIKNRKGSFINDVTKGVCIP